MPITTEPVTYDEVCTYLECWGYKPNDGPTTHPNYPLVVSDRAKDQRIAELEALCREAAAGLSMLRTAIDDDDGPGIEREFIATAMIQARLENAGEGK